MCQHLSGIVKRTYLSGAPSTMPPWISGTYVKAPHWEYGDLFWGTPPIYVRFDPPLKS